MLASADPNIQTAAGTGTNESTFTVPEKLFFRIVAWALLVISLKLIWDGGSGLR